MVHTNKYSYKAKKKSRAEEGRRPGVMRGPDRCGSYGKSGGNLNRDVRRVAYFGR